jgi:hypothetical protein
MLDKKLSWVLIAGALAVAAQGSAQRESPESQADLAREYAAQQAELEAQQADFEREVAREQAAVASVEREFADQLARQHALTAAEHANLQRELSQARQELARAVGDVARVSAQMRYPVQKRTTRDMRVVVGNQAVLGLNIEDSDFGVFVRGVTPNGPAATAGVAVGDTIVSINDVELARAEGRSSPSAALLGQIGNVVPGDDVKLRVLRGGDYHDFVVKAGESNVRAPFVFSTDRGAWAGGNWMRFGHIGAWSDIEIVSLTPELGEYFGVEKGLLVVRAGSASELGFRDGDVIIDLAGREPQSPEHALRILASFEPGESLQAAIMRQRRRESLAIRVPTEQ